MNLNVLSDVMERYQSSIKGKRSTEKHFQIKLPFSHSISHVKSLKAAQHFLYLCNYCFYLPFSPQTSFSFLAFEKALNLLRST